MTKMYSERVKNIPAFRGCSFGCVYCAFKRLVQMNRKCPDCAEFKPHVHLEALDKTPPKTKPGEFLTIGLSGDVSFMDVNRFCDVLDYCSKWGDRTFLIQSKNPAFFLEYKFPENVIIGTTIETNWCLMLNPVSDLAIAYNEISQAPYPYERYKAMCELNTRKAVTIEPVLSFNTQVFWKWITNIKPEVVYIGYNSGSVRLPEPSLARTQQLIYTLRDSGIEVREKLMRKAWWEEQ